jgi:hypothetical protein
VSDFPWIVWSNEHRAFWNPDRRGYTQSIEKAGRYTKREAEAICANANYRCNSTINVDTPPEICMPAPESLSAAIEPFADFHGDLPDYDHPLRPCYESGIQYAVELLAKELGVDDYRICDGTEEFDGDLGGTLMNIVLAAMPKDDDGDPIWPRDLPAMLAARASLTGEKA